jgi:predicted PurR-regulated permease PerM
MNIELSQVLLNNGITFLVVVTAILLCVVGYFLIKLLKDLSVLTKNLNETSEILNNELKPTLKELNETMRSINSIIQSTDEGVGNVKTGIANAITKTKEISGNIFGGFLKGFMTVYSLFKK